mgnify:FL=1
MDNIVKIAIIIGIIIIGVTGIFVYIKIKKIDEEDNYDEIEIDDKDTIKLDLLNDNSNLAKESTLNNDSKVINNVNDKFIDNVEKEEKVIPEVKMPVFQTKEVVKEEVNDNVDIESKVENKIEKKIENELVSNTSGSKLYSNKYSSTSTLISPVGYYSNELVRNDLMGKRASKVEKTVVNEIKVIEEEKPVVSVTEPVLEVKKPVVEVKKEVKEEIKNNKISFADMKQTYVKKEDKPKNFMEEVSEKLSRELKPQTIELTDYEQKQEDEAIISYQELLANKDKTFNISDDEEDEDFISALKSFRDSL